MRDKFIDNLLSGTRSEVRARVWIISDLQQKDPGMAREYMELVVRDFKKINLECDRIFCLGDTVAGSDMELIEEMSSMQEEMLSSLGIPLRYVLGNHELDVIRNREISPVRIPFYDRVKSHPEWRTTENLDDFYFSEKLGGCHFFFLSDHADPDGSWCMNHGKIHGDVNKYPYTKEDMQALTREISSSNQPVITVSHYAFPGGNRSEDSNMLAQMLPLPSNVLIHFYGHMHLGDQGWGKEHYKRKISWVNYHDIPQLDVASLENRRGDAMRSVFLEIYRNNGLAVYYREHDRQRWSDVYGKQWKI